MSDELKRCPHCGGEAKAFYCEESGTFDVQCQQCGAIPFIGSRTSEIRTLDGVIAAWNARAAVTDEQFSRAVHDGRAWQVVRECVWEIGLRKGDDGTQYFTECGEAYILEEPYPRCPSCGGVVKVVG